MAGEEWARRILEKELCQTVVINDDGSASGMYDLRVASADALLMAVECVGAVDSTWTETWNIGPATGPWNLATTGDWTVTLRPTARINAVRRHIESLLSQLEAQGLLHVHVDYTLKQHDAALFRELSALQVAHCSCFRQSGGGKLHLTLTGSGGAVDSLGAETPRWIGEFLRDRARQDVLEKLKQSAATHCHVFVIVSFGGAPWAVESYLTGELDHLPQDPPDLPVPITGVWMVAGFGRKGLRWDGNTWRLFAARGEMIDDII